MSTMKTAVVNGMEREIVEIEGLPFVEIGSDTVRFYPQSKDVMGITFVEGNEYENGFGRYWVRYIRPEGTMDVEYVSSKRFEVSVGYRATYPMKAQAEAILGMKRQFEAELRMDGVVDLRECDKELAAWVIKHGRAYIQLPSTALETFLEKYERVTGCKPSGDRMVIRDYYWGEGLHVEFPLPAEGTVMAMPSDLHLMVSGNRVTVANCAFVWGLIKAGMRLGEQAQAA